MRSAKSVGQIIGVLLLLQLATGLTMPFVLLRPLTTGSPDFLASAAASSFQIRTAVFLSFVGGALAVGIAITAWQVFSRHSYTMALWFLAACVFSCSLDAVHNASVMSMLSLSQEYAKAGAADAGLFRALGTGVALARKWAHYTQLFGFGSWIFLFYLSLWRFALIPRALAALGLVGIMLQFTGVTLLGFLGYRIVTEMAMPLGPIHLAVAIWLMARGFRER